MAYWLITRRSNTRVMARISMRLTGQAGGLQVLVLVGVGELEGWVRGR